MRETSKHIIPIRRSRLSDTIFPEANHIAEPNCKCEPVGELEVPEGHAFYYNDNSTAVVWRHRHFDPQTASLGFTLPPWEEQR